MKLIFKIFIFVLIPLSLFADNYPSCNFSKTSFIYFSSKSNKDKLSIIIKGNPCFEASLELTITKISGEILYSYSSDFSDHTAVHWEDENFDQVAADFATRLTKGSEFHSSSKLPQWLPENEYYEEYYQGLTVSKEYYQKLRKKDWGIFSHSNHYEGWQILVFDQHQQKVVQVSTGGI